MNILYVLYFICLYVSMLLTRTSINQFHSNAYWEEMENFHFLSEDDREALYSHTRHILYWLNADRYYWNSADAQNLAEAFFAMGNVASICRICFLLPIIGFVGPLQVNSTSLSFSEERPLCRVFPFRSDHVGTNDSRYFQMVGDYSDLLLCFCLFIISHLLLFCCVFTTTSIDLRYFSFITRSRVEFEYSQWSTLSWLVLSND